MRGQEGGGAEGGRSPAEEASRGRIWIGTRGQGVGGPRTRAPMRRFVQKPGIFCKEWTSQGHKATIRLHRRFIFFDSCLTEDRFLATQKRVLCPSL